jgi:DMSO/TMAO reductase YedYZ molybdopterin-dependent catalytic subunit
MSLSEMNSAESMNEAVASKLDELATIEVGRRGFLKGASLAALGVAAGAGLPATAFAQAPAAAPAAPAPAAAPAAPAPFNFPGKDPGLVSLGDNPLNVETPAALLDDDTTPASKFFIRTHGINPEPVADPDAWQLVIDGEVDNPITITVGELKSRYENVTYRMVLECAGNWRSFFVPAASGNQWTTGGVGCAEWTGVRLRDVLNDARPKATAIYTAHHSADRHLSGEAGRAALSRGIPIAKAMDEYTLLVWAMNGEPLPNINGGPLRVLVPGFPGSASQKWIQRIQLREVVHDGSGMTGLSYKLPTQPIVPGTPAAEVDPATFTIIENMPVKSLITSPANGTTITGNRIDIRGAAWDGEDEVASVDISIDGGVTWQPVELQAAKNKYDWRRWTASVEVPAPGYYEIRSRATDSNGRSQSIVPTNWNPSGYGGNSIRQVAVLVTA